MILELMLSCLLAGATILFHLEALRLLSRMWTKLVIRARLRFALLTGGVLLTHIAEIWVYAIVFLIVGHTAPGSGLAGETGNSFLDYLYFSSASYTSLGIGDVYPMGRLRLLSTTETLNGLLMIAWSAAFTYLYMQRYWGSGDGGSPHV